MSFAKCVLIAALLFAASDASAQVEDIQNDVSPQDKLQIKVLEWLPAKGEYREWTAVGGEYAVAPNNTLSIPFVGSISTAGRNPAELSADIATALQRGLSLPTKPEVGIQFLTRSPVYVLGGVETPGKVDYTPGLTAIEAVALSGGFYRGAGGTLRLERDAINAEGDLASAQDSVARLRARIARLEAENAGRDAMTVETSKAMSEPQKTFLEEEKKLFDVRLQARTSRLDSLQNRQQLAKDQLQALNEKMQNIDRQIALTKEQLGSVNTLVDKGLAVTTRSFELERTLADLEGKRVDLDIASLAANLEINQAERDQVDLVTEFRTEVAGDMQSTRAQLAKTTLEVERAQSLLREATVIAPEKLLDKAGNMQVGIQIFLTRKTEGGVSTFEIGKDEVLRSGDTIQVQLNPEQEALENKSVALR